MLMILFVHLSWKTIVEPQQVLLDEVLNRRAEGEPVAYIVGYRDFGIYVYLCHQRHPYHVPRLNYW